ncbi:MAG: hypothetical protein methR_P1444 [Methyloprofundus sp.]|nr:MAG: hypothetical protein methR_P1444 [Methyloprofundus sp.]
MIDLFFEMLPQVHGTGHSDMGAVKGLEAFLTFIESLTTKSGPEIFASFFPGMAALDNIHPLLVHFPITLLVLFFCADTIGGLLAKPKWREFATPLLYIGTIAAILTVIAGFQAAYSAPHNDVTHAIMLRHQAFGIAVTLIALTLSIRRLFAAEDFILKKTYGYFALSSLLVILLTFGADLGGFMVYQHGVAVAPVMQNTLPPRPEPKHDHGSMAHNHGSTAHSHSHNAAPHTHEPIIPPTQPAPHTHSHDTAHSHDGHEHHSH